ncbi:MAG: class I SAM-dependent RNA methyltransferase [Defluviitaleaceae bacterium]|nr:class I SAM-dependent RNA methyltransferase [Defluviitaleaceae bacterium]
MEKLNFIATSTFGLEAIVKREAERLGFSDISVPYDGRINFSGNLETMAKANVWLRSADRVLLNLKEFYAYTFDELFDTTKSLPWEDLLPKDANIIITAKSVKSKLFSLSDCQSIVKKAIVERLKAKYKIEWLPETGATYKIQVGILKDLVTLTVDTSGTGLHKRGYRQASVKAPIKETLAAALIDLSFYRHDRVLLDPFCGSATIPIEAAMMAKNIAPGMNRDFVAETWGNSFKKVFDDAREEAKSLIKHDISPEIYASDLDPIAINTAKYNSKLANVADYIKFNARSYEDAHFSGDYGIMIANPPYGERVGESEDVLNLAKGLGELYKKNPTWSFYVITSDAGFEKQFGKKSDKNRKLFNGMLQTYYYQYLGPKKPREGK